MKQISHSTHSATKYRSIGLTILRIASGILFVIAFSQAADAQSGFEPSQYEPCDAGFERSTISSDCVMKCPAGFTNLGLTCGKPKPYGRGAGNFGLSKAAAIKTCEDANRRDGDGDSPAGQKCEMWGLLAYPKCISGYSAAGPNLCSPNCPPGSTSVGAVCSRPSRKAVPRQMQRDIVNSDTRPRANGEEPPVPSQIEICSQSLQGKVAWNREGNKVWGDANIRRLCSGTVNANATIACFSSEVQRSNDWSGAIESCRAGGSGRQPQPQPQPQPRPQPPPEPQLDLTGWTVCAAEGGRCQFEGTADVRYGVGNKWAIQSNYNGVDCNNTVFGDPAPGLAKQCLLSPNITPNAAPDVNIRDANGNNDLHLAVGRNDLPAINDLLNRGIDVNALNNSNETPVTFAVEFDNTPALLAMLAKGGDLDAAVNRMALRNREGMLRAVAGSYPIRMTNEMFERAVNSGAIGIAQLSLNYGVDPNFALGYTIRWLNNVPLIEAALRAGANANPALYYALETGNQDLAVKAITQYRSSPEEAMTYAIQFGSMTILQLALDRGANATVGLRIAARKGNVEMVKAVLAKNADPSAGLVPSLESGNDTITEMLLTQGADPNPAMPYAIERQKVALVRRLLEAKANARDQLILRLAGKAGNIEIIDMLIAAGGYPISIVGGAIEKRNYDVTKYLLDKGADAAFEDFIDVAARNGDLRIVELLLERGANPTKGMWGAVQSGNAPIVQLLIDKKADVSFPILIAAAAEKGNLGIVTLLLEGGANPENGMSSAVTGGFADIVGILGEKGANAAKPEYILHAVKMGNRPLASQLFLHGAPKEVMDETGQPLIIVAALRWDPLLVDLLLKNGVDPNAKNRAGDTALHIVANDEASKGYPKFQKMKKARLPVVQALIDGGAAVNATNAKGETVRKSLGGGDGDVKKILDAAGAVNKLGEN